MSRVLRMSNLRVFFIAILVYQGDLHIGPRMVQNVFCSSGQGQNHCNKRPKHTLSEEEKSHVLLCANSR